MTPWLTPPLPRADLTGVSPSVPSIAIEGTTARLRGHSGATPAGMNWLLAIVHWFFAAGAATRRSLVRHERNARPPGQCRAQALFQHGHYVRPMRRMDVAAVIPVHRQPGRTGPPLGHEPGLLQQPMMPVIQNAQGTAVPLGPNAHLILQPRGPLHPPLAPLLLVFLGQKAPAITPAWWRRRLHTETLRARPFATNRADEQLQADS